MFIHKKGREHREGEEVTFDKWLASSLSFIIVGVSGILGAGGPFILAHIMPAILNITCQTHHRFFSCHYISLFYGSTVGKVITGKVLFVLALVLIIASLIASCSRRTVVNVIGTRR